MTQGQILSHIKIATLVLAAKSLPPTSMIIERSYRVRFFLESRGWAFCFVAVERAHGWMGSLLLLRACWRCWSVEVVLALRCLLPFSALRVGSLVYESGLRFRFFLYLARGFRSPPLLLTWRNDSFF